MNWLSESLKQEVRKTLEPRYMRKLNDSEVEDIAINLTSWMETILKFKWRQKYGDGVSRP